MFQRHRVNDVKRGARRRIHSRRVDAVAHYYVTPRHVAVTRSKANETSNSASRTIRRWILVAATRFANYPKQLKASSKKIRRRYLGRSENNSDTRPPASSRPSLALNETHLRLLQASARLCLSAVSSSSFSSSCASFFFLLFSPSPPFLYHRVLKRRLICETATSERDSIALKSGTVSRNVGAASGNARLDSDHL